MQRIASYLTSLGESEEAFYKLMSFCLEGDANWVMISRIMRASNLANRLPGNQSLALPMKRLRPTLLIFLRLYPSKTVPNMFLMRLIQRASSSATGRLESNFLSNSIPNLVLRKIIILVAMRYYSSGLHLYF